MNSPNGTRNRLLALMSPADRDRLAPSIEVVELDTRQILETPGEVISHAFFVESGLVSVVGTAPPGHRIEIGMVGYEGMSGVGIVLGDDRSPNEAMVQSAGSALRISARPLRQAMAASPSLASILLRYAHVFMIQSGQTALANGRGRLDERLARWLLNAGRPHPPEPLTVTHEFLALLLGCAAARRYGHHERFGGQRVDPLQPGAGSDSQSRGVETRSEWLLRHPRSRIRTHAPIALVSRGGEATPTIRRPGLGTLVMDDQSHVPWMTSAGDRFALAVFLFGVLLLAAGVAIWCAIYFD